MTVDPPDTTMSRVARRVGDAQRAEHAERLAEAFARGELSRVELEARTDLCLGAVTDGDLARLVADLPGRTTATSGTVAPRPGPAWQGVSVTKVVAFELALLVVAYVLGVDLESELRSWYLIAFEIWVVGTVAGAGGALLLRPSDAPRAGE